MSDGARRDDMVSLTVGISLPICGASKRDPRVADGLAMRHVSVTWIRSQKPGARQEAPNAIIWTVAAPIAGDGKS
jgi:hypothetical protein